MHDTHLIQPSDLPKSELLLMLAEEASELAQAALKLRRALDGTNPTPKPVEKCEADLIEEMADVELCFSVLDPYIGYSNGRSTSSEAFTLTRMMEIKRAKYDRWVARLNQ